MESTSTLSHRRPAVVTWLAAGVLTCAAFYLARLVLSLGLPNLPLSVPTWYLPLTGAVWGGVALALGIGLLRGSVRAYRLLFWAVPIYLGWYWADRLLLVRSDFAQRSTPAGLLMSALVVILVCLALLRPSVRTYFRERTHG
jgi:hypothetical protein